MKKVLKIIGIILGTLMGIIIITLLAFSLVKGKAAKNFMHSGEKMLLN